MKSSKLAALLTLVLLLAAPAFSQTDRGTITGTVTDPAGAAVAGAKVTATDITTNEIRETTTTGEGNYTLPQLKADPYKVTVEAQGFKTSSADEVIVAVQVTRRADFTLEIG